MASDLSTPSTIHCWLLCRKAREMCVPIVMVTSGGYQRSTARIIADSVLNLCEKGLMSNDSPMDWKALSTVARGTYTLDLSARVSLSILLYAS